MLFRRINWFIYKNKVTHDGKFTMNYGSLILGMKKKDQIVIGKNVDLNGCLSVGKKGKIILGDYALMGPRALIQAEDRVEVGRFAYIAPDVLIIDSNHHSIYAKDRMIDTLGVEARIFGVHAVSKPIKIGNHVWIARRAIVLKGVTIGDRSVIAANTVVTQDVPPDVIVAGNPGRIVKHIDQEPVNPDEIMSPDEVLKKLDKGIFSFPSKKVPQKKQFKSWHPQKPTSQGATAYHNAVVNTSWHKENINGLLKIVQGKTKNDDIIVDFGAGTGASTVYLLKGIKKNFVVWLVDNSASWLGKAYELLNNNSQVKFFLLEKIGKGYATLDQTIGREATNYVLSANTVHLIPNIEETFAGINKALKPNGLFVFQSGNIVRNGREKGRLMIDDTVNKVHDIAITIIRSDNKFAKYKKGLGIKIKKTESQRRLVFPTPRPVEYYVKILKSTGFHDAKINHKPIRVKYRDWLNFLTVKRLQAGILPEIGGIEPSSEEEKDRDEIIRMASLQLFSNLQKENPSANKVSFTSEWVYIQAKK